MGVAPRRRTPKRPVPNLKPSIVVTESFVDIQYNGNVRLRRVPLYYRTPKSIGRAIRNRRKALELTQADLARRTGVSRQWIAAVERGKPRAEIGLILRTFNVLDMTIMFTASEPSEWLEGSAIDKAATGGKRPFG